MPRRRAHACLYLTVWIPFSLRRTRQVYCLANWKLMRQLAPTSNFAAFSNHFCSLLNCTSIPQGVLVIATAISSQSLHPILSQRHVFGDILKITPPNKDIRRQVSCIIDLLPCRGSSQILQTLVNQQMGLSSEARETSASLDFVTLGSMTEGYTAADLRDLVSSALQQAVIRSTQADEPVGQRGPLFGRLLRYRSPSC